jgi:HPt (histidine-containing phosphotransfer) domain-containing protein
MDLRSVARNALFTDAELSPIGLGERDLKSEREGVAMANATGDIVNWSVFGQARAELGADFVRILGYFREDGTKSVAAIEEAMRALSAVALVRPAHTLKGESLQFGAEPLGELAERIELVARRCVETRDSPDELIEDVVKLRPLFEETLARFEREANPLANRRPAVFGRKVAAGSFGGR